MSEQPEVNAGIESELEILRLVRTKSGPANAPALPRHLIERHRLYNRLGSHAPTKVSVIVAPPGFGKTVLAIDWASKFADAWRYIRLSELDNDQVVLLESLFAGLNVPPVIEGGAEALAAWLNALPKPLTVILDDVDCVRDPRARALLSEIFLSPDANVRVALIGRTEPQLQIGRLRLLDEVQALYGNELLFTKSETEQLLGTVVVSDCNAGERASNIQTETSGWPAAVHLAAASVEEAHRRAIDDIDARRHIAHHWIDAYIDEAVLAPMSVEARVATIVAAIAPHRVSDARRIANTQSPTAHGVSGQHSFESLLIAWPGILVDSRMLDSMADGVLRVSIRYPEELESAATWLIQAGDLSAAAALVLRSGNLALLETNALAIARAYAVRSDFDRISTWTDQFPPETVAHNVELTWFNVASEVLRGRLRTARAQSGDWLSDLPRTTKPDPLFAGRMLLLDGARAYFNSDDERAIAHLHPALDLLPEDATTERLQAATFQILICFRAGDDLGAANWERVALGLAAKLPIDELWSWRMTAMARANGYVLRGEVGSANTKYRTMLAELPKSAGFLEGFIRTRLVSLLIERNDLDAAERELDMLAQLVVQDPVEPTWTHHFMLARLRWLVANGRFVEAEAIGTDQIIRMRRKPEKSQLVLLLARLWLLRGDHAMVRSWLEDVIAIDYPAVTVFGDINYRELELDLLLSELVFDQAIELGNSLLTEAREKRRVSEEIRFSIRLAVAHLKSAEGAAAESFAESAIELAMRGGFVRALLVPGIDVANEFIPVWNKTSSRQRLRQQLLAMTASSSVDASHSLSKREIELIRLVALGRSNQQIALDLFISVNTVRNHLVRINQRLSAGSRIEAVARARELGLIE